MDRPYIAMSTLQNGVVVGSTGKTHDPCQNRKFTCLLLTTFMASCFLLFAISYFHGKGASFTAFTPLNVQTRVSQTFPKHIVDWLRSCGGIFSLIILEPECIKCLGSSFGNSCDIIDQPLNIYRFAIIDDVYNHSFREWALEKLLTCSTSLAWTNKYVINQSIILNKPSLTVIISSLESRQHYWYIHGADMGGDIQEPPRAFLKLNLTYYEEAGVNFLIPYPVDFYLWQWPRSRFLECRHELAESLRKRYPEFYNRPPVLPDSFVDYLVYCRDLLLNYRFTVMLGGGTALGWYRECGLIPHTTDTDIMFLATEWNPQVEEILKKDPVLKLSWILGTPDDGLELTVHCGGSKIDINGLFEEGNRTYTGAVIASERKKIRWYYPSFKGACTADLKGHLFYVRCDIEDHLIAEYGSTWYEHHHSNQFYWTQSHHNVQHMDTYNDTQWPLVYRVFN